MTDEFLHDPQGPPPADVEMRSFAYGCGAADVDGICSAVVLRMATDIGPVTVISRVEISPENARELAAKLIDLAEKVEQKVPIP